jgi:hypothetical protein
MDGWVIECRTGCSCCSDENHWRGPYKTENEVKDAVARFKAGPLLASQYSERGNYNPQKIDVEELPGGRLILDGTRVVPGWATDADNEYLGRDL